MLLDIILYLDALALHIIISPIQDPLDVNSNPFRHMHLYEPGVFTHSVSTPKTEKYNIAISFIYKKKHTYQQRQNLFIKARKPFILGHNSNWSALIS